MISENQQWKRTTSIISQNLSESLRSFCRSFSNALRYHRRNMTANVKVRETRNAVAIWQGPQNLLPEARLTYRTASFWLSVGSPPWRTWPAHGTWKCEKPIVPWPSGIWKCEKPIVPWPSGTWKCEKPIVPWPSGIWKCGTWIPEPILSVLLLLDSCFSNMYHVGNQVCLWLHECAELIATQIEEEHMLNSKGAHIWGSPVL